MKKNIRIIFVTLLLFICSQAFAEHVPTKIYIYGFSTSFNDSTVYFTDIIELDSAWVEKKHGFLYSRDNYSAQLKSYLIEKGVVNPTCVVSFSKTQKEINKKMEKLKKRYTRKDKHYLVNYIPSAEFEFEAIDASDDEQAIHKETKEEKKARKLAEKEKKRKEKEKKAQARKRNKHPMTGGTSK